MAKLKVSVNSERCIASGDCVETAPTAFGFDAAGKSQVLATAASRELTLAGARSCPVKAITVVDEETGTQLYPLAKR